jgi:hypothetical protein
MLSNSMNTLQDLEKLVQRRNKVAARNNALAARDPQFAARLAQARATDLDQRAAAALQQVYQQAQVQGMGSLTTIVVGSVVGSVFVVALSLLWWQIQREEREFAQANPIQATLQSAMTSVWAILGLGALAIGGLMYWDYRSGGAGGGSRRLGSGKERPFDQRPPQLKKELEGIGGELKELKKLRAQRTKTAVDDDLVARMAEERAIHELGDEAPDPLATAVDEDLESRMAEERAIHEAAEAAERGEQPVSAGWLGGQRRVPIRQRRYLR